MQTNTPGQFKTELAEQVKADILLEIYRAARVPDVDWMRSIVNRLVSKPVDRFSRMISAFDADVGARGFTAAAGTILGQLTHPAAQEGANHIPTDGPLIIAANHPGAYDGLAILSSLPRDDFRLLVSGVPFFRNLPNSSRYLIFTTNQIVERMAVLRQSIHHLKEGGSLLIFPSGRLDPDPAIFPKEAMSFGHWSRSVQVFLEKVPQAKLVVAIASGVVSQRYLRHPLMRLMRSDHEKRRLTEFLQVLRQMALGLLEALNPKVTFSKPYAIADLNQLSSSDTQKGLSSLAEHTLASHLSSFYP